MKKSSLFLLLCASWSVQGSFMPHRNPSLNPIVLQHRGMVEMDRNRADKCIRLERYVNKSSAWDKLLIDASRGDLNAVWICFASPHMPSVDVNKVDDRSGDTLLIRAVESKNIELVNLLIYLGADVNKSNNAGSTPLMKAIYSKNSAMINFLLSVQNVSLDVKNFFEETALMIASSFGDVATIEELVAKGANVNLLDNQGQTAYDRLRYFVSDPDAYKASIENAKNLLQLKLTAQK